MNDVLALEIVAGGTQFQATDSSMAAFTRLLVANQWMIFRNVLAGVSHWDFVSEFPKTSVSSLTHYSIVRTWPHHKPPGRCQSVCFRLNTTTSSSHVIIRATANLKTNLTQIQVLGQQWNSPSISQVYSNLTLNTTSANSGSLIGNRMFYANDYMASSISIWL